MSFGIPPGAGREDWKVRVLSTSFALEDIWLT